MITLDKNLQLRILIADSNIAAADRLNNALIRLQTADAVNCVVSLVRSVKAAYEILGSFKPNVVFLDLVSTGLRDSLSYVQHLRKEHPTIAFVLYCRKVELEAADIYEGWGARLRHYFLLPKETDDRNFDEELVFNLSRAQLDLYAYGAQESLSRTENFGTAQLSQIQLSKLNTQFTLLSRDISTYLSGQTAGRALTKRRAFVIGAIADDLRDAYQLGIKETLRTFGLDAYRVDEHYKDRLIIQTIYEEIHSSEIIVAELSYPRPNCYYELGFADALGKPVIRVAKSGVTLPFDVNQHPFIFYSDVTDLRNRLGSALIEVGLKPEVVP